MNDMENVIKTAEFVKGIKGSDDILRDGVPHVAFVGRSNVGKSSSINYILSRKSLVKTSSKPGKTTEINFFFVNESVYFVDLPGYGFAKMSKKSSDKLDRHILWYLTQSEVRPEYVVMVIDSKVGMTSLDKDVLALLNEEGHSVLVISNKIDKLKKNDIRKRIDVVREQSGDKKVFPFSAKEKKGREEFLEYVGLGE